MSESLYAGLTSQTIDVFLGDSSSTTGGGLTGLAYNTASLTCYYRKGATGASTAITLATQTVGGAWSSGGFVQIDSTNMPGVYRFDVPNAVIDTEGYATIYFRGATNLVPTAIRIDCRALPSDVKKWLGTAAATPSVAGVPEVDLTHVAGATTNVSALATNVDAILTDTGTDGVVVAAGSKTGYSLTATTGLGNQTADITGSLSGSVGSVTGAVGSVTGNVGGNVAGSVGSVTAAVTLPTIPTAWITADGIAANAIGSSEIADGAITAAKIAADAIDADALAADAVTEIQSGLSTLTAAGVRSAVGLASANLDTQLDALPTNTELATALAAADDAVLAAIAALNNLSAAQVTAAVPTVTQIWTTALTESYRSVGAAGTPAQLLHEIIAHLGDSAISGTTKTINTRAGSAAKTYTLDSAVTPTSISEAS